MTSLLANIDPAFKTLAPRAADWLSILPEIAVAGLALLCLLQALLLPPAYQNHNLCPKVHVDTLLWRPTRERAGAA